MSRFPSIERGYKHRGVALRRGLPYGVVMATAGASTLAGHCGLPALVVPLLGLAILQALGILMIGMWRHRAEFRAGWSAWLAVGPVGEHTGIHTVPLGLAVITGGLADVARADTVLWLSFVAGACFVFCVLLAILCVARFLWSLVVYRQALHTMDGTWFLVPAALLGTTVAAESVASQATDWQVPALHWLALVMAIAGWLGYSTVVAVAAIRTWRFGLGGVPQPPWWIAMGCAGLAAAALGHVLDTPITDSTMDAALVAAMFATNVCAALLCPPLVVCGVDFLLRRCRFRAGAAWPPTFSTAVFALGCLGTGAALPSTFFRYLGLAAGFATLAFWAVTAGWNATHRAEYLLRALTN